jgi:hypothetical protein
MAKFRVKLGLGERDVPNKIEFGRIVHDDMLAAVATFATPLPTLPQLKTATDDLEDAYNDSNHGVLSTATLHDKEEVFDTIMTAMGNYVDSIAQGSQVIINLAGMDASEATHVPVPIVKVTGVEGRSGSLTGETVWDWDRVKGARVYLGYLKKDGESDEEYKLTVIVTKSKATISGLDPGVKYILKLKAVGASGVGPESDPASAYAAF